MVGDGNNNAIDIFPVEQGAVVMVGLSSRFATGNALLGAFGVAIGDSHDFRGCGKLIHEQVAPTAGADESDAYTIICSEDTARKDERRGSNGEQHATRNVRLAHCLTMIVLRGQGSGRCLIE